MSELPKIVRARLNAVSAGDHPDPDVLNAFAEKALTDVERTDVLTHLSHCVDCRDVLALAVPAAIGKTPADTSIDTARGASWFHWRVIRWGALAACVVIVGSAVVMKRNSLVMSRSAPTVAMNDETLANQPAYERSVDSTAASSPRARKEASEAQQAAAMNAALEPPSTKLTGEGQAQAMKKALPQRPSPPAPMGLEKKIHGSLVAGVGHGAGIVGGAVPGTLQSSPTTPPDAEESRKNLPAQSRVVADLALAPKSSETAEPQNAAAAPAAEAAAPADSRDKQEAIGKAKPAAPIVDRMMDADSETTASRQLTVSKEIAAKANRERAYSANAPLSRWTISSDGQLQHSIDSGKSWQPVAVAERAVFRALSANGPDIWVGGSSGALYHSSDSGSHWQQVKPATDGATLSADVAAIEFVDVRRGKITTSTGEVWLTEDAGQTWHKQP
jgi:Photosynthesis system II assembly factor YCF48